MALLRVKIRGFKISALKAGPVVMDSLTLVHEEEREENGDPWDVVAFTAEALVKRYDFVEIEAEVLERDPANPGEAEIPDKIYKGEYGSHVKGRRGKHLAHRPVKVWKVGVLYLDKLAEKSEGGHFVLAPDDIEWYDVDGSHYVYEGNVSVEAGERTPVYLVLDTEEGFRWVRLIPRDAPLRVPEKESESETRSPPGAP